MLLTWKLERHTSALSDMVVDLTVTDTCGVLVGTVVPQRRGEPSLQGVHARGACGAVRGRQVDFLGE